MWVYGKCYVSKIEFDQQNKAFHLYTVGFFGGEKHEIDASKLLSSRHHKGALNSEVRVKAPWRAVRIKGRRLPFIVDEQGAFLEEDLMNKFLTLENYGLVS